MHNALATRTEDPAFACDGTDSSSLERDAARLEAQIHSAIDALKQQFTKLPDDILLPVAALISRRNDMLQLADSLRRLQGSEAGIRIRIHGDYHLGQVLRTADDFVLLDFEGEPARSLEERRLKQSPLRDVAGMLRSFSYAAAAGFGTEPSEAREAWEHNAADAFMEGYRTATADSPRGSEAAEAVLLRAYLLEKALYEIIYEVNNRPDWIAIPLTGILGLLDNTGGRA
jgi:maltose alpha-D-glucosyltransferase/alpha-amylase